MPHMRRQTFLLRLFTAATLLLRLTAKPQDTPASSFVCMQDLACKASRQRNLLYVCSVQGWR
jgi:hypothetical protein